jgi:hypothetical protein
MEAIEVTAHFDVLGKATPLRFTWQGSVYPIESVGRRWKAEDRLHILVMVPEGRIFELIFDCKESCWYLERAETARMVA